MNLISNPNFWLNFSFLIIIALTFIPPIRKKICGLFIRQRQQIETDIQSANAVYQEALETHKGAKKSLNLKLEDPDFQVKKDHIIQEFNDKIQNEIAIKTQDIQVRKNLLLNQTQKHIKEQLLNSAEEEILNLKKAKMTEQEFIHFIQILHKNKELLKTGLK